MTTRISYSVTSQNGKNDHIYLYTQIYIASLYMNLRGKNYIVLKLCLVSHVNNIQDVLQHFLAYK